jgi:hypothetical protein
MGEAAGQLLGLSVKARFKEHMRKRLKPVNNAHFSKKMPLIIKFKHHIIEGASSLWRTLLSLEN